MSAPLSITPLSRTQAVAATWTALDDDGSDLNMASVDGRVYVRVRTATVIPGQVVAISGASACSRGTIHNITITLASDAAFDVYVPRGRFGGLVIVSSDATGVTAYAYAVPPSLST